MRFVRALIASVTMTLISSCVPRSVEMVYPGTMDCENGCEFAAGGWPFAYIVDRHGLSPSGSADLLGALVGADMVRWDEMRMTLLFWLFIYVSVAISRTIRSRADNQI